MDSTHFAWFDKLSQLKKSEFFINKLTQLNKFELSLLDVLPEWGTLKKLIKNGMLFL